MKNKKTLSILIIVVLAFAVFQTDNLNSITGKAYNEFMSWDFRPVLSKDIKPIKENLLLLENNIKYIKKNCSTDTNQLQNKFIKKREDIEDISFKNLVLDINPKKKELFLLSKETYKLIDKCNLKKKKAIKKIKTYSISSNDFEKKIILENELNYYTKIENLGNSTIKPRLIINEIDFTSINSIYSSIINEKMNDKEKSLAIYNFVKEHKYHFFNPTKYDNKKSIDLFNSWGYSNCGVTSRAVIDLANLAKIPAREHRLGGHIVSELFFEDSWHVLDADGGVYYTKKDGTIASVSDIERKIELLKTAESSIYSFDYLKKAYETKNNNVIIPYKSNYNSESSYELKPNEAILFVDDNNGNYFSSVNYQEPPNYSNSYFIYEPELKDKKEHIIDFNYPFPIVGGYIEGVSSSKIEIFFSNGLIWNKVYSEEKGGLSIDFSNYFNNGHGVPDKAYRLKIKTDNIIEEIKIVSEVQVSSKSLPLLKKDKENKIRFIDDHKNNNANIKLTLGFID